MASASAINRSAERSHLVVMEFLVLREKRGLKASNARLQSLVIIPVCLFDLPLAQRRDRRKFVRPYGCPDLGAVKRAHAPMAEAE